MEGIPNSAPKIEREFAPIELERWDVMMERVITAAEKILAVANSAKGSGVGKEQVHALIDINAEIVDLEFDLAPRPETPRQITTPEGTT